MKADFYTTAVRTGNAGMGGISLLLIEKGTPGITLKKIKTAGWLSSNTALIIFEDVKVPVKNLIGIENQGFLAIMMNFNMERLVGIVMSVRASRICIEEAITYARARKTFGKRLIDSQVIRHKIAKMAYDTEAIWTQVEFVSYQMQKNPNNANIAGFIAMLKVQVTRNLEYCAREASQVLGGNSCLRTGVGAKVERIYRDVRIGAIGGGSEEVMLDLAMRQAKL